MRYAHPDRSLIDCTDFLGNHSATVAKTVAQDLESGRVSEEKAVFSMIAGGDKIRGGCRVALKSQVEMAEMMLNAHKLQEKRNKPKKEKRDF